MLRRPLTTLAFAVCLAPALLTGCKRQPDLAHRVEAQIHARLPAAKVTVKDASTLDVAIGEQKVTVNLDNLATNCTKLPSECDSGIDHLVNNLARLGEPEKPVTTAELRLTPRARKTVEDNKKLIAEKSPPDKLADNQLVVYPFQADIMLTLVRDMPDGIAVMNHGALVGMKLDDEKARTIALANLEKELTSLPTVQASPGVFRVRANDNYEAARILVPKLWDGLAKQVNGDLLVIAPTRDTVFATGSKDTAALAVMIVLAKKEFDTGPYSLSTAVLKRTDAGFVVTTPP